MRIISLFSGAGGLDLGLIQAGHHIVWANDNDTDAVASYKLNLGEHIFFGDIESFKTNNVPYADVIVGGFPCQGFSQANLLRSPEDNRNKLYRHFIRFIEAKKPLWFLAENVRGILSLGRGSAIKKIELDFSRVGYRVKYQLFNMADYGVPQNRWRVIIAGTRKDLPANADYQYPEPTHCDPLKLQKIQKNREGVLLPWINCSEALKDVPEPGESSDNLPNHIYSKYKVTDRNFTGHRMTDPNKPSPTILARGNGGGGVCAIQHPQNHRRMTIREAAIIQTFPRDFRFSGKMNSCYRQVGNAVPVLFARLLGDQLLKLEKFAKAQK